MKSTEPVSNVKRPCVAVSTAKPVIAKFLAIFPAVPGVRRFFLLCSRVANSMESMPSSYVGTTPEERPETPYDETFVVLLTSIPVWEALLTSDPPADVFVVHVRL